MTAHAFSTDDRATALGRLHRMLAQAIARNYADAIPVDRYADEILGWQPKPGHCHAQVAAWLNEHPEDAPLRGWATMCHLSDAMRFASHSRVRTSAGEVIDVAWPRTTVYRFLAHPDSAGDFLALVLGEPTIPWVDVPAETGTGQALSPYRLPL